MTDWNKAAPPPAGCSAPARRSWNLLILAMMTVSGWLLGWTLSAAREPARPEPAALPATAPGGPGLAARLAELEQAAAQAARRRAWHPPLTAPLEPQPLAVRSDGG